MHSSGSKDFAVVRYNTNGTLDNSFAGNGKAGVDFSGGYDIANSVAIQTDGKIVVAGYDIGNEGYDFVVMRYNSNGSLDNSFNGDGKKVIGFGRQ